jgi:hypothetical protein
MNNTENNRYKANEEIISFNNNNCDYCKRGSGKDNHRLVVTDVSNFLKKYRSKERDFDALRFKILHIRHESTTKYTKDELSELVTLFAKNRCIWFNESTVSDHHLECFKNCRILKLMSFGYELTNEGIGHLKNIEDLELRFASEINSEGMKYLKKIKRLIVDECDYIDADTLSNISTLEYLKYEPCKNKEKYEQYTDKLNEREKELYNSKFVFTMNHYNKMKKNLKRLYSANKVFEEKLEELLKEKDIYGAIPESDY